MSKSIKRSQSLYGVNKPTLVDSTGSKKQGNKLLDERNKPPALNLSLSDCTCPICLEILEQPVVLPCKHELCLSCFSGMTDKTNFLCPMCRMRISTWSRMATNTNTLVDQERWSQIQRAFPKELKDRREGKTAIKLAESIRQEKETPKPTYVVSNPGEIRKEYEESMRREQERIRLEREKEEAMSLNYIQQVIREEGVLTLNDYIRIVDSHPKTPAQPNSISIDSTEVNRSVNTAPVQTAVIEQMPVQTNSSAVAPILGEVTNSVGTASALSKLRPRASLKRNMDEVKSIRNHLLSTMHESKSRAEKSIIEEESTPQPKIKKQIRTAAAANSFNASEIILSGDESNANISSSDLHTPHTSTLSRRGSTRIRKPRQTNL